MADQAKPKATQRPKNFYAEAANDPEVLAKRAERKAELDRAVQQMLTENPGRAPRWDPDRIKNMDRFCLENGKRCIMWDDDGAGFYLMMNWDWVLNCPTEPESWDDQVEREHGWYCNIRHLLSKPLLDTDVPEEELAAWIDKHTMRVHGGFLDKLPKMRKGDSKWGFTLDDPYWQELQAITPWNPAPGLDRPAPPPPYARGVYPPPVPAAVPQAAK